MTRGRCRLLPAGAPSVGLSEEAIERFGPDGVKVHRARFRPMSQALPARDPKVLLKLVLEAASGKVVGCHMVGEHAAEIIQMAAIAIGMGATKADFDRTMALHPTISEEFVTCPTKTMRTLLISGASRGIGRAMAERLLSDGHRLSLACATQMTSRAVLRPGARRDRSRPAPSL